MILVLAGTKDSREIIKHLKKLEKSIVASVVTDYGYKLVAKSGVEVIKEKLDKPKMKELIINRKINLIVDATHPFALEVSQNAIEVSQQLEIDYIRFERQEMKVKDNDLIIKVENYLEAVNKAQDFERILLTIGSKKLSYFTKKITDWQKRLVARILPNWKFIQQAQKLGFTPKNLIAMQGPFSKELNQVLIQDYGIDVVVTKASGITGGLDTKLQAALELEVPVILITRPKLNYGTVVDNHRELINQIWEQ